MKSNITQDKYKMQILTIEKLELVCLIFAWIIKTID